MHHLGEDGRAGKSCEHGAIGNAGGITLIADVIENDAGALHAARFDVLDREQRVVQSAELVVHDDDDRQRERLRKVCDRDA